MTFFSAQTFLTIIMMLSLGLGQAPTAHPPHRVYIVDELKYTGVKAYGNTARGEEDRNHSAPGIIAEFRRHCPVVAFTSTQDSAEFVLGTNSEAHQAKLEDQSGKELFVSHARRQKHMVSDVCNFIKGR